MSNDELKQGLLSLLDFYTESAAVVDPQWVDKIRNEIFLLCELHRKKEN